MRRFWLRFANLFRGEKAESELAREIEAHLALLQEDFERRGLRPAEARLAAKREYGGVERAKELHRAERSFVWIEQFFKDVRHGWTGLLRNPGFTLTAVIALALGIGVNATIFGIYNAVALKQLPLNDPSRVMRVKRWSGTNSYAYKYTFAYPEYEYLRDHNSVFSGVTASTAALPVLESMRGGVAERVYGYAVSANYFADLGVNARIGRTFFPEEDRVLDANPVVVLSCGFWRKNLHADPAVLGQTIKLNGLAYTIVGVAPEEFTGTAVNPTEAAFWAPLSMIGQLDPSFGPAPDSSWHETWRDTSHAGFELLARLKSGVAPGTAQAESTGVLRRYLAGYRETQPTTAITIQKASYFGVAGDFWLNALAAAMLTIVSLVLLVACANVANMLLARGVARQREIGIRLALGASRARVIRQLLMESVLLALLGGAAAIPASAWAGHFLWATLTGFAQGAAQEFQDVNLNVAPDAHVFLYGLALSLLTGILFGLAPAMQSTRADLNTAIKQEGAAQGFQISGGQGARSRLRGLLLGTQVAISVLLLAVSGQQLRRLSSSFATASDLGYNSRDTYQASGFFGNNPVQVAERRQRLRERLETLPEVSNVSHGEPPPLAIQLPLTAGKWTGQALTSSASEGYFETLGIPLLQGRGFTRLEADRGAPLAVISEATERRAWPDQDALGKSVSLRMPQGGYSDYEVIGVARDLRFVLITEMDPTHVYLPTGVSIFSSRPTFFWGQLLFRIHGNRDKALAAVQSAVETVDPSLLPRLNLSSLEEGPITLQRVFFRLVALFPSVLTLLSLTLAGVGIFGVMAFLVSQRTKEIGIRVALGATSGVVVRSIVLQGLRPVFVGILAGMGASIPVEAVMQAKGLGLSMLTLDKETHWFSAAADPIVLAELALVLGIAVLASVIPARRAMSVDPMVALRYE